MKKVIIQRRLLPSKTHPGMGRKSIPTFKKEWRVIVSGRETFRMGEAHKKDLVPPYETVYQDNKKSSLARFLVLLGHEERWLKSYLMELIGMERMPF